jgi:hypothetical protein
MLVCFSLILVFLEACVIIVSPMSLHHCSFVQGKDEASKTIEQEWGLWPEPVVFLRGSSERDGELSPDFKFSSSGTCALETAFRRYCRILQREIMSAGLIRKENSINAPVRRLDVTVHQCKTALQLPMDEEYFMYIDSPTSHINGVCVF